MNSVTIDPFDQLDHDFVFDGLHSFSPAPTLSGQLLQTQNSFPNNEGISGIYRFLFCSVPTKADNALREQIRQQIESDIQKELKQAELMQQLNNMQRMQAAQVDQPQHGMYNPMQTYDTYHNDVRAAAYRYSISLWSYELPCS